MDWYLIKSISEQVKIFSRKLAISGGKQTWWTLKGLCVIYIYLIELYATLRWKLGHLSKVKTINAHLEENSMVPNGPRC
jgi:hypothetical protein